MRHGQTRFYHDEDYARDVRQENEHMDTPCPVPATVASPDWYLPAAERKARAEAAKREAA